MILLLGSTILSILDILVMWLIARRFRIGWLVDVFVNTLWFPYDWVTHQFGFFALGLAYYWVAWDGWKHWHDRERTANVKTCEESSKRKTSGSTPTPIGETARGEI